MELKALKDFSSNKQGNVVAGQVIECDADEAKHYMANGLAASYGTKVVREVPTVAGEAKPFVSSPAAPVSRKKMRKKRK